VPRFLALDADAGGLFVAAGTVGRGGLAVEQTAAAADDLGPLTPANAAARGARLRELLAAAAIKPAPLLLAVGRDRVILKDVTHPPTAPAEEPAVVRFQASRDLPDAADDVVMDYLPLPAAADGQRRAAAVFVRKEVLAAARQLADAAGLKLAGVTPRPFLVPALLTRVGGVTQPAAVVTAWPGGGEFTVVADGRVRFTRPLTAADPLPEVRRNLQVSPEPVAEVIVCESGLALSGRLADAVAVPVRAFDPGEGVPGGELVAPTLRGRLAGPLGLLSHKHAADALPINFVVPRAPRAEPSKNRPRALLAGVAASAVLGLGAVFAYLEYDKAQARVAELVTQKKAVQARLDALQPNVARLKAADEFAAREVVVLDELFDLASRVPDVTKVQVVEFELKAEAPPAPKRGVPAVAAGKAPPAPVAGMRVLLRSTDDGRPLVQQIVDSINRDKQYYAKAKWGMNPTTEAGNKGVQFVVTADLFRRPPDKYARRIAAELPPPPAAPAPPAGDFGFGGFGP
jgi:hypothetical protein